MRSDDLPCLWVTKQGGPLRVTGLDEAVRTLGRRAGIEGVRYSPHTFRHTFATSWLRNGGSEFALQSALGHSSLDMTRRYSSTVRSEDAAVEHRRVSPADNLKLS